MTKETKPTSKVIQVTSAQITEGIIARTFLCEDGSVWENSSFLNKAWECILEPHKEPVEEERELKKGDKVIYTDEITKEEIKGTISFISVFCGSTVYFIDSLPDTYINEESLRLQEPVEEESTKEKNLDPWHDYREFHEAKPTKENVSNSTPLKLNPLTPDELEALKMANIVLNNYNKGIEGL